MIRNIIFDIGNVLAGFTWQEFFTELGYEGERFDRLANATVKSPDWNEVDRGVLGEEELLERFIKNDPPMETDIRRVFQDVGGMVRKLDYAVPWVESLKAAGYGCYYLSNFSHKVYVECAEALEFLPYMDGGILSYRDKVIKPDTKIYELLLSRYGLKVSECVFLDDTQKNLPPAEKLGMHTILFRDQKQAEGELEKLGICVAV